MTKLLPCDCVNEQQDRLHGRGIRVCNKTKADNPTFRCTVCSKEHQRGEAKKAKK